MTECPRPLIKVLLATHIGTGCDSLSRIGTKFSALNAIPGMYLGGFKTRELDDVQIVIGVLDEGL